MLEAKEGDYDHQLDKTPEIGKVSSHPSITKVCPKRRIAAS
jgi:hypothetical protein